MRVLAIVNQKGGCGKTTTAVNLAAVLARDGARTLLVDMDPQSHCAAGLGVPDLTLERTIGDAMVADHATPPVADEYLWEVGRNLRLAPSNVGLAALEAPNGPLAQRYDRDRRLARVLAQWQDDFDWCVIDCPPTIGLLTYNALRAADLVLIPVETGFFSLKGAEKQIRTIESIVARFGREIPFRLLPTLMNESRALSRDVVAALARRFPEALLPVAIREHEELREAASYGQSVCEFAPGGEAERDFEALVAWLGEHPPLARALAEVGGGFIPRIETEPAALEALLGRTPAGTAALAPETTGAAPAATVVASSAVAPVSASGTSAAAVSPAMSPAMSAPAAVPATSRLADVASRALDRDGRLRLPTPHGMRFGVRLSPAAPGLVVFAQPVSARATSVVGDFNDWNPAAHPMRPSADGARLEVAVALPPGRHRYRIACDGVAIADEFNTHADLGAQCSLVEVPAGAHAAVATATRHDPSLATARGAAEEGVR
ncbi:MAG: hypothetical protein RI967_1326 [Planctomycetota bacterium]